MNKIAILINSCDAYSDLWPYFFRLLQINWKSINEYNIYLNTEKITKFETEIPVTIINTKQEGIDQWGKRLINSLSNIKEDYVVVLMDDFFLRKPLDDQRLLKCVQYFEEEERVSVFYLAHVYRRSFPESVYKGFVEIPKHTNYRLNSCPALWKKEKLLTYIKETDNPWAWEYFGGCRTNHTEDLFFCVEKGKPIYDYAHAIYRGKWLDNEIQPLINEFCLDIDTSVRGTVKETDSLPKRSKKWKMKFVLEGIRMVGPEAILEMIKDKRNAKQNQ